MKCHTYRIHVKGLVQGVGFRPFVYRLAMRFGLYGWVENRNDGVIIEINTYQELCDEFEKAILTEAPLASSISSISSHITDSKIFNDFKIVKSKDTSNEITDISPDISVCEECLDDMNNQKNRINYPFINCTNCGPRFTIIQDLPYDRDKTTMKPFEMCHYCNSEYTDILDRRFHAQPVACSVCGPEYKLHYNSEIINGIDNILSKTAELLESGKIIAIKGLGGFHLACDAQNQKAVNRLRKLKDREGKPLAVMFADIENLKEFATISTIEEDLLQSWKRPIVLVKDKMKLAPDVCVRLNSLGAILPYMPFHYLLFDKLNIPAIVLTSGNLSDEPIIIDNEVAKKRLTTVSDALLTYNREIYNRTDDSVQKIILDVPRMFRRSRSYAPSPINLGLNVEGVVACGAELVNCFCIGKGQQAIMSQHIGDLKNLETLEFFTESLEQYKKLFRMSPTVIACDLHPDYLSSKYAKESGLDVVKIQHHHAHIASCMAEHNLDEKVIGVSFDGTGLGDDNNIWGSEFLICDLADYERIIHYDYIPMPGGDKAAEQPWRMGISYLYKQYGKEFMSLKLPFIDSIKKEPVDLLMEAIDKNINSPLSSGAGRLFDAVAAITNICPYADFHAEGPMRLESVIDNNCNEEYDFDLNNTICFDKAIKGIVDDLVSEVSIPIVATKFHNTNISAIIVGVETIAKKYSINKVVLSGGTFQNKYILERVTTKLQQSDFEVYSNSIVPANDGGIALGQLVVASKRRSMQINSD